MKKIQFLLTALALVFAITCKKEESPAVVAPVVAPVPTEKIVEIKTSFGNMYIWLYKETPGHRNNFLGLADTNFFDSTAFHRIISNFVIQGGDINSKDNDPGNDGSGDLGYTIPAEFNANLTHVFGAVAAARLPDNINPTKASDASQFYIVVNANGYHSLDNKYTVFGIVMKGTDVAVTIAGQPKNGSDHPLTDIKMDVNILEKTLAEIKSEYDFTPPL